MSQTPATPFQFPLLAFTKDNDMWAFDNDGELTTCGPQTLRDQMQEGMEVVDPDGGCWRVRAVTQVGRAGFSWRTLLQPRMARIRHDWEPRPRLELAEVQDKICASLRAHPDYWLHFPDDAEELAARIAEVRAAPNIASIRKLFGFDDFRGY